MVRSLAVYYGVPFRHTRMRKFYGQFLKAGDLCFDVGAHVGNRVRVWQSLGARVVALEPQPDYYRILKLFFGGRDRVTLLQSAVGSTRGEAELYLCEDSPTLATLSTRWMRQVKKAENFRKVNWSDILRVPVTTLDHLIDEYGVPVFCKIDVEGFEEEVLAGLSRPISCLSFEYIPADINAALACLRRISNLGSYEFNVSTVETMRFEWEHWQDPAVVKYFLEELPRTGRSGDVYARCR